MIKFQWHILHSGQLQASIIVIWGKRKDVLGFCVLTQIHSTTI